MQTVLLADGAEGFSEELRQILSSEYEVLSAQDGSKAMALLKECRPDLLILDLEVPMIDGLTLLQRLTHDDHRPAVLVLARLLSDYTVDALSRMGVGYLMRKPCKAMNVADRAKELLAYQAKEDARINRSIAHMLEALSMPMNLRGSKYLPMAIRAMRADPAQYITKELYPSIGKTYGIDGKRVERCIRNAIDKGWECGDPEIWKRYFGVDKNGNTIKPSNSVFILKLVEILTMDL